MTEMLVALLSATLISQYMLRLSLPGDPQLERLRVHALGLATTLLVALAGISSYLLDLFCCSRWRWARYGCLPTCPR